MSVKSNLTLLSNAGATGTPVVINKGGLYQYLVNGTFTGATIVLQTLSIDGVTYIPVPNSSMTAAGSLNVELPAGSTVRAAITGGPPTGMYASLGFVR